MSITNNHESHYVTVLDNVNHVSIAYDSLGWRSTNSYLFGSANISDPFYLCPFLPFKEQERSLLATVRLQRSV